MYVNSTELPDSPEEGEKQGAQDHYTSQHFELLMKGNGRVPFDIRQELGKDKGNQQSEQSQQQEDGLPVQHIGYRDANRNSKHHGAAEPENDGTDRTAQFIRGTNLAAVPIAATRYTPELIPRMMREPISSHTWLLA